MDIKQEDLVRFWKWCGFTPITFIQEYPNISTNHPEDVVKWLFPDKDTDYHLPKLDLNNLYKYAIPKLQKGGKFVYLIADSDGEFTCRIETKLGSLIPETTFNSPTEALYNAILKIIDNEVK